MTNVCPANVCPIPGCSGYIDMISYSKITGEAIMQCNKCKLRITRRMVKK